MFKRVYFETTSSDDEVVLQPEIFEHVSDQQSQFARAHINLHEVPSNGTIYSKISLHNFFLLLSYIIHISCDWGLQMHS
jgi:hypothetical protein